MGVDNAALLAELGYAPETIDRLRADGVIAEGVASSQSGW
jgi:hypothetical protein